MSLNEVFAKGLCTKSLHNAPLASSICTRPPRAIEWLRFASPPDLPPFLRCIWLKTRKRFIQSVAEVAIHPRTVSAHHVSAEPLHSATTQLAFSAQPLHQVARVCPGLRANRSHRRSYEWPQVSESHYIAHQHDLHRCRNLHLCTGSLHRLLTAYASV